MFRLIYAPHFVRQFKRLPIKLQEETAEKIILFKGSKNHLALKVHKLHGQFSGCFSFSVNFKTRVVFEYVSKKEIALLTVSNHDVYQ